ncbi:MAG: thiosulfate oxidation carrier complex protein SoxZ [Alphaproteobacteria bacterium]
MADYRINMPERASPGEIIEIRTLISHAMHNGYTADDTGHRVPRQIINTFYVTYNGVEVFRANMHPAQAANPFLQFYTVAVESGTLEFTWIDDDGSVYSGAQDIIVE